MLHLVLKWWTGSGHLTRHAWTRRRVKIRTETPIRHYPSCVLANLARRLQYYHEFRGVSVEPSIGSVLICRLFSWLKGNCQHDRIPFNLKWNKNVFAWVHERCQWSCVAHNNGSIFCNVSPFATLHNHFETRSFKRSLQGGWRCTLSDKVTKRRPRKIFKWHMLFQHFPRFCHGVKNGNFNGTTGSFWPGPYRLFTVVHER